MLSAGSRGSGTAAYSSNWDELILEPPAQVSDHSGHTRPIVVDVDDMPAPISASFDRQLDCAMGVVYERVHLVAAAVGQPSPNAALPNPPTADLGGACDVDQ
jgi:hypothetical protein